MIFTAIFTALVAFLASSAAATPLEKRVTVRDGTIASPTDGTVVSPGNSYAFQYNLINWCQAGYTSFDVYLLDNEPTAASMNTTQGFTDYVYYYGRYTVDNFPDGLPPMGTPPPSTLPMLDIGSSYDGQDIWLTVVQTELYCPPDGHTEYMLASNNMVYSA
ncbi:hypothetical protein PsYK624_052880 [Phanerochaete sordida]|uniref:Uncharacterized protein n=1 Tax=Phanerochaete sordida TaxID=48140 RepID=A0A9P3G4V0_9APHY|nr:hypothetical protein PsYK624_052880 [Phanerochaete sordida]